MQKENIVARITNVFIRVGFLLSIISLIFIVIDWFTGGLFPERTLMDIIFH